MVNKSGKSNLCYIDSDLIVIRWIPVRQAEEPQPAAITGVFFLPVGGLLPAQALSRRRNFASGMLQKAAYRFFAFLGIAWQ